MDVSKTGGTTPIGIAGGVSRGNSIFRLGGVAAITGGALRVADAYIAAASGANVQQIAYLLTDVMLLAGLCGLYLVFRKALGIVGHLGFVVAASGLVLVRASALTGSGQNAYLAGAAITLVGVVAMGTTIMVRTSFPKLGPVMWIASFVIGLLGLMSAKMSWAIALAGVIFGAGFAVAGVNLLQEDRKVARS